MPILPTSAINASACAMYLVRYADQAAVLLKTGNGECFAFGIVRKDLRLTIVQDAVTAAMHMKVNAEASKIPKPSIAYAGKQNGVTGIMPRINSGKHNGFGGTDNRLEAHPPKRICE
jgi:hypothetical protein